MPSDRFAKVYQDPAIRIQPLAGYEDTNDAERLAEDPAFQMARRVTLDVDSSESPVHGGQEQSAYNGHFENPDSGMVRRLVPGVGR